MMEISHDSGVAYLKALLNHKLRVTTSDTRMFVGDFRCTDSDKNIIMSDSYEYRLPSVAAPGAETKTGSVVKDMTSRYLGLVVVPGEYVTKIEVEEFASQLKGRTSKWLSTEASDAARVV